MTRTARCCCEQCSIEVEGEPAINAVCHCGNCKRRTGSAFGWSSYFEDAQVLGKFGELKAYSIRNEQERWFCAQCGTTLFWHSIHFPGQTGIAGGCFQDMPLPPPSLTVANEGRCAWVGLPTHWQASF
jgi:hypothetical protein